MNIKNIIGIDPGNSGGIAILAGKTIKAHKMPVLEREGKNGKKIKETDVDKIRLLITSFPRESTLVIIEKVNIFPSDSSEHNFGKQFRIQKMMENYSYLLSIVKIFQYTYMEISPVTWQSYLRLKEKGLSKQERKAKYKRAAQNWFGKALNKKVNLYTADALCLVQYGRHMVNEEKVIHEENENLLF